MQRRPWESAFPLIQLRRRRVCILPLLIGKYPGFSVTDHLFCWGRIMEQFWLLNLSPWHSLIIPLIQRPLTDRLYWVLVSYSGCNQLHNTRLLYLSDNHLFTKLPNFRNSLSPHYSYSAHMTLVSTLCRSGVSGLWWLPGNATVSTWVDKMVHLSMSWAKFFYSFLIPGTEKSP